MSAARILAAEVDVSGRWTEEMPAGGRLPHGAYQILFRAAFDDVADRPVPERLGNEGIAAVKG